MAVNTRFTTGVHAMVLLAAEPRSLQTSEDIANHLDTNPVVIRRVFSLLHQAGLVESQKGPNGGSRLSRPARDIALSDIYRALDGGELFHSPDFSGASALRTAGALTQVFKGAEKALREELSHTTLDKLLKKSQRKDRK